MKWLRNGSGWLALMAVHVVVVVMAQPNPNSPPGMISLQLHRTKSSNGGRRRGRRAMQLLDETPLFRSSVFLWCGTPPQRRDLGIDTGSYATAFICSDCNDCGTHFDDPFDQSASSTYQKVGCDVCALQNGCTSSGGCLDQASYGDGDGWSGYQAIDQCFVAGDYPNSTLTSSLFTFNYTFSCQTSLIGSFKTTIQDGILGLSYNNRSLWAQMYDAGKIQHRAFSVCYAPSLELGFADDTQTLDEGTLTLGGSDTRLHDTPLVYSSNPTTDDVYFHATLRKVYLQAASGTSSPTTLATLNLTETALNTPVTPLVDSGTTVIQFTPVWLDALKEAWLAVTGSPFDPNTVYNSTDDFSSLPTLLFQFVGDPSNAALATTTGLAGALDPEHPLDIIVAFPPSHYLNGNGLSDGVVTGYAFAAGFTSDQTILGANFMMGHDILFDLDNDRLGWAESGCNYSDLAAATAAPTSAPTAAPVVKPTAAPVKPTAKPVRKPKAAPPVKTKAPVFVLPKKKSDSGKKKLFPGNRRG